MNKQAKLPAWLNLWVVIGSVSIAMLLLCLAAGFFVLTAQNKPVPQSTAILEVIRAATATARVRRGPQRRLRERRASRPGRVGDRGLRHPHGLTKRVNEPLRKADVVAR